MAAKTKAASKKTGIKGARLKARHAQKRRPVARRISPKPVSTTLEDVLISSIALQGDAGQSSGLLIELLYNLTSSTRSLGYGSGFRIGERLSELHNPSNSLHPLINALSSAGFSSIMYYPHKNSAIFEMVHHKDCKMNLDATLHIFESGMIAGYLSRSTGIKMEVTETMCAHDGKGKCRFVAERTGAIKAPAAFEGTREIVSSIKAALSHGGEKSISTAYFALAISPLTKTPLKEELSKLLFLIGKELSPTLGLRKGELGQLAGILSLSELGATSTRRGINAINLSLLPAASTSGYLDLVSALLSGVLFHKSGKLPAITRGLSRGGSYYAQLKI